MAHHKATLKSIRQTAKRTERNRSTISKMRTFVRRVEDSISAGQKEEAQKNFKDMQPVLAGCAQKGLLHLNTISRKLSRLSAKIKALS